MPNLKKLAYLLLPILALFLLTACGKPSHHPTNPNYGIKKPKVVYKANRKNLGKMVKKLNGSPYVWAEEGPKNFDCSGYTYYMYGSMGIELPRVARAQAKVGRYIKPTELQYGDLIFFDTTKKRNGKITHVGMYLGDGWFTHASTTEYEVVYSNLRTSKYYKKRLRICRRYLPDHKTKIAAATPKVTPWKAVQSLPATTATLAGTTAAVQPTIPQATTQKPIVLAQENTHIDTSETALPNRPLIDASTGTYYVQVGSFKGRPKSTLLYNITRNGYKYKMIRFPRNGTQISKLLIGAYKDKASALEVLPKVRASIEKAAFIAEIL